MKILPNDIALLALTQAFVRRTGRCGWQDRQVILRDISMATCISALAWGALALSRHGAAHVPTMILAATVAIVAGVDAARRHLRVGSETEEMGRLIARQDASLERWQSADWRNLGVSCCALMLLTTAVLLVFHLALGTVAFPLSTMFVTVCMTLSTASDYVEATDPDSPAG